MQIKRANHIQFGFTSALIVDDHPLFCEALSLTLQAVADIQQLKTAPSLQSAIELLKKGSEVDLILLDLNLPDAEGLDGLVRIRNSTSSPIIVVSSMVDQRVISSAIHAGAKGFIPKHSQRDIFKAAIATLARGERFLPSGFELLDDSALTSKDDAIERLSSLTAQQARILQMICEGMLNKQIAFDLSIAETTVKAHVTAIMRKLGVQSRTQAVLLAKRASFDTLREMKLN